MKTTTARKSKPGTLTCRCLRRPMPPCESTPGGWPGLLEINGAQYGVMYHTQQDGQISGLRLVKIGETLPYDISAGGECDCADCVYRQRECKHMAAVALLIERGDLLRF